MNEYYNRDLKRQYNWLPKGITSSIICTVAAGRWSIILSILSNGEFLCLITDDIGNANKFYDLLNILIYAPLNDEYINEVMVTSFSSYLFYL